MEPPAYQTIRDPFLASVGLLSTSGTLVGPGDTFIGVGDPLITYPILYALVAMLEIPAWHNS